MKQKVISKLVLIMLAIGVTLTLLESYNFRNYGVSSALNKAEAISEVVKNGLTSHMVNGNMDKRDIFLNSIADMKNVDQLWVVRGDNVTNQYGETALDLCREREVWDFNADFYHGSLHIIATPEGIEINPSTPKV